MVPSPSREPRNFDRTRWGTLLAVKPNVNWTRPEFSSNGQCRPDLDEVAQISTSTSGYHDALQQISKALARSPGSRHSGNPVPLPSGFPSLQTQRGLVV